MGDVAAASIQWGGFAVARAASAPDEGPLADDGLSGQIQLGIDWFASPRLSAHLHLVGRDDSDSVRGNAGIVEAYLEGNFSPAGDRLRVRAGAMFLPTSKENIDALWENAYTITSSALNTWLGEELRPIGVDASYYARGGLTAGVTLFRGNDTFGALPPVRGWRIGDRWTLLGEWVPVDPIYSTSVSAETDDTIGWSARGGWRGERVSLQLTRIDNRSDALEHGALFNWRTRFDIAAFEYSGENWSVAAESGWGPTVIIVHGNAFTSELRASYVTVSRRFPSGRISVRAEEFDDGDASEEALTLSAFWTPRGAWRPGLELSTAGGRERILLEMRYSFAGR